MENHEIATTLQHLHEDFVDKPQGSVVPPIVQTSTFAFKTAEEYKLATTRSQVSGNWVYSRVSNPTVEMAEAKIAALEGAEACRLVTSGMAAISASILHVLRTSGGRKHVVCVDTAYGPTREFLSRYCEPFGITVTYVSGLCSDEFEAAITDDTMLVYLESPSSIVMRLQDLGAIAQLCKARGITTIIDNTYNAGLLCQPISFGIDIAVHSVTKYMGGHSDVVAGAIVTSRQRIEKISLDEIQFLGALLPPFPAWLINRGLRTIQMRLERSAATANKVADWLQAQPEVQEVFHAGRYSDQGQQQLFEMQMKGSGGLLSFMPRNQSEEAQNKFINALKLFQIGVSWGGHESLVVPYHGQPLGFEQPIRLVRLYLGLEDAGELISDLEQAIQYV